MKRFCSHCGQELERGVNWTLNNQRSHRHVCGKCSSVPVRQWQTANADHHAEYKRAWRIANPDKVRASQRAWEERNRDYRRQKAREYYQANREVILAKAKAKSDAKRDLTKD